MEDDTVSNNNDDESLDLHLRIVERLAASTVAVVGLGGVGSWAAEALCRSGVGNLILVDLDDICISNTNRQLHATSTTVGHMKIDEMRRRLIDINPQCQVTNIHDFVSAATPPNNETKLLTMYTTQQIDYVRQCGPTVGFVVAGSFGLFGCH